MLVMICIILICSTKTYMYQKRRKHTKIRESAVAHIKSVGGKERKEGGGEGGKRWWKMEEKGKSLHPAIKS